MILEAEIINHTNTNNAAVGYHLFQSLFSNKNKTTNNLLRTLYDHCTLNHWSRTRTRWVFTFTQKYNKHLNSNRSWTNRSHCPLAFPFHLPRVYNFSQDAATKPSSIAVFTSQRTLSNIFMNSLKVASKRKKKPKNRMLTIQIFDRRAQKQSLYLKIRYNQAQYPRGLSTSPLHEILRRLNITPKI